MLCTACVLFSCNQDEMLMNEQDEVLLNSPSLLLREVQPDVRVEDGCLVLRNLDVRDSITSLLNGMTDEERIAWEKAMGFESAVTHFAPYFAKYDNVQSVEECERFARDYASVMQITRDEEGLVEVDYPFNAQGYESVVNKDGRVRVGNALYIYKNNRRIVVHEATPERVAEYENATMADEYALVDVVYNGGLPMTRANGVADIVIASHKYVEVVKKKQYKWQLLYVYEREMTSKTQFIASTSLKLYQKARKKYLGGWHNYKTKYHYSGNSEVRITGCYNDTFKKDGVDFSVEKGDHAYFVIFKAETLAYLNVDYFANDKHMRHHLEGFILHKPDCVKGWDVLNDPEKVGIYRIDLDTIVGTEEHEARLKNKMYYE